MQKELMDEKLNYCMYTTCVRMQNIQIDNSR